MIAQTKYYNVSATKILKSIKMRNDECVPALLWKIVNFLIKIEKFTRKFFPVWKIFRTRVLVDYMPSVFFTIFLTILRIM